MNVQTLLMKLGIPTFVYSVNTQLSGNIKEKIGDTMEVTVGWVYGLSVNVEGTQPQNAGNANIVSADALKLFLNLKYGSSIYVNSLRLNHLCFDNLQVPANPQFNSDQKYFPVNIPVATDLKQSYYDNPTLLTSAKWVSLNMFYIDKATYLDLLKEKVLLASGRPADANYMATIAKS